MGVLAGENTVACQQEGTHLCRITINGEWKWNAGLDVWHAGSCWAVQPSLSPQEPEVLITVQVVDEAGAPIPNAEVAVWGVTQFGGREGITYIAQIPWGTTDSNGKAAFTLFGIFQRP
jgi:hypothetical protein